jgi:hypothetical protein
VSSNFDSITNSTWMSAMDLEYLAQNICSETDSAAGKEDGDIASKSESRKRTARLRSRFDSSLEPLPSRQNAGLSQEGGTLAELFPNEPCASKAKETPGLASWHFFP